VTGEGVPEPTTASQPPPGDPAPSIGEVPPPADLPPPADDAGDTRGWHFRRLARNPAVLGVTAILAAIVGIAVGAQVGAAIGAAAIGAVVICALIVVWVLASSRAADDFFTAYAAGRGLIRVDGKTNLPPLTPLLRKGDHRYAEQRFNGVLPGGLDGSLCLFTYEDQSTDSKGNRETTYVHFTIVMTQLPDTAPLLRELFCQRRFGFRFMDSMEDVFRSRQRVEHESEAVDREFEVFIGESDDLNVARQVLSPTFLVWLEANADEAFAFELVAGSLVANVKGHKKSAADLDRLCEVSAAVARRLQQEAAESA
jgi:hypothetical protein